MLVGVKAVIARALEESYSLAVEGVHVVPGALPRSYDGAVVVQCMLAIPDEDEHARHFWIRDAGSQGLRPMQKYLRALPEIRGIQDYLIERAEKAGVPVVENTRMESAVERGHPPGRSPRSSAPRTRHGLERSRAALPVRGVRGRHGARGARGRALAGPRRRQGGRGVGLRRR